MFSQLGSVEKRFQEIESRLADVTLRPEEFIQLSQEYAGLQEIVTQYRRYQALQRSYQENEGLLEESDLELVALAKAELKDLEAEKQEVEKNLQILLLPKDPLDDKNILLEIRAGAGGEEAALFVGELFRSYEKYVERQGWKIHILSLNPTGIGGFREIISEVQGERVYSQLKWEAGVHRVQRIPKTEAQGRVHTSTVTVAILPEAEEVDISLNPSDLRIDVFRSGGAGGQGVNTTDSAVRITHLPSGFVVVCQDERSQLKNKDRAMKILRSRLLKAATQQAQQSHADARRSMVGTGDRSERIRTYNFPQGRLTDHRIGLTLYQLPEIMEGRIDPLIQALTSHYQMEALKSQT